MATRQIVNRFAKLWPRELFDILDGNGLSLKNYESLKKPGVYILYRDDLPYYIGKSKKALYDRLDKHANVSSDKYFNFWNFFSYFVVSDNKHIDEIEAILIASMPTSNRAVPRIKEERIPASDAKKLRENRRNGSESRR